MFFCYGVYYLSTLICYAAGMPEINPGDRIATLVGGTTMTVGGILLIGIAKAVVAISYPK
jgi:hypothetical protein